MVEPYIRWHSRQLTVRETLDRIDHSDIYFSDHGIWPTDKMSKLIESIVCDFPLPPIYVRQDIRGDWEIIDGAKRLKSLVCFVNGGFPLEGLTILPELNSLWKGDLPNSWKTSLSRKHLQFHILDPMTSKDVPELVIQHLKG